MNARETTPTLEKRKNEFGAGQVGQLFDEVEAQKSKVAQRQTVNAEVYVTLVPIEQRPNIGCVFIYNKHLKRLTQLVEHFHHSLLMGCLTIWYDSPTEYLVWCPPLWIDEFHNVTAQPRSSVCFSVARFDQSCKGFF